MIGLDSIQKEVTKVSIISFSLACLLLAQTFLGYILLLVQPQSKAAFFIFQAIIPIAVLAANAYALIFSIKNPEFDKKIPIAGTAISLAFLIYLIILVLTL